MDAEFIELLICILNNCQKLKTDQSFSEPVEDRLNKKRQENDEKQKLKQQIAYCYSFVPAINQRSKSIVLRKKNSRQNASALNLKKNTTPNIFGTSFDNA